MDKHYTLDPELSGNFICLEVTLFAAVKSFDANIVISGNFVCPLAPELPDENFSTYFSEFGYLVQKFRTRQEV